MRVTALSYAARMTVRVTISLLSRQTRGIGADLNARSQPGGASSACSIRVVPLLKIESPCDDHLFDWLCHEAVE